MGRPHNVGLGECLHNEGETRMCVCVYVCVSVCVCVCVCVRTTAYTI